LSLSFFGKRPRSLFQGGGADEKQNGRERKDNKNDKNDLSLSRRRKKNNPKEEKTLVL
jgi:hypothetical protein